MPFPTKSWQQMTDCEKNHFREMDEKTLISRWQTPEGKSILNQIIDINFNQKSNYVYESFIGTVKTDWGKKSPKFDLRGIDLSDFSNLKNDEIFDFDFSNCALHYANFSGAELSGSNFSGSDILYSDFSFSILGDCNFSKSNLTLSNFESSDLDNANFSDAWMTSINFKNADLGFVKFNRKTDFHNIDISAATGESNPLLISFIRRKQYLKHFKQHSFVNKILYYIWMFISDCGQSLPRWSLASLLICLFFGFYYSSVPELFQIANDRVPSEFTFYYYSVVTFTTLGFGDIIPISIFSEVAVTIEVIIGYLMLGGLISIFATKFIPKE